MEKRSKRIVTRRNDVSLRRRNPNASPVLVDFTKLEMTSLRKYEQYFQLQVDCASMYRIIIQGGNTNKKDLISNVRKHFAVAPKLNEVQVISAFLYAIRKGK